MAAAFEFALQDAELVSSEVVPSLYVPVRMRLFRPPTLSVIGAGLIARLVRVLAETIGV
jgi:hypothetical protein